MRGRKYNNKYNQYNNNYNNYKKDKYSHQNKSKKNIHISKFLSLVLRHKAKDFGLDVEPSGFIKLQDILDLPQSINKSITLEKVQEIVANDEKGRFELVNRPPYYIRAVQGHSMSEVSNEDTLTKLNKNTIFDFPTVVHGTQEEYWKLIEKSALNRMNRNAIHFSIGYNDENHVKSGMRLNCEVFIEINPQYAFFNGFDFFISKNKVILCPGNESGCLPLKYIKKVKDVKGKILLSCEYDIIIKYNVNCYEIFKNNNSLNKIEEPNKVGEYLIEKELMKEKVIVVVEEKDEKKYIDLIKTEVENGNIKYPALFVDYLIENKDNNNFYSSEFIKKVDIDWNIFYEQKNYKNEDDKKEDEKDEEED